MKRNKLLIAFIVGVIIIGDVECRKNTRTRPSRPAARTTPRPRQRPSSTEHDHVNPNKIGWAVPGATSHNRHNSGNLGPKPSAPLPDQNFASKASAPSLQSGYPGQNHQNSYQSSGNYHGQNQGYNPPVGQQHNQPYNPSVGQSHPYNPSVGQSYHQPGGQSYNPSVGQPYHQPAGQPYNPPVGQPYNPSVGQPYHQPVGQPYNPPVGQPYNPSVGQPYHQPVGQPYNPPVGQTVILAPAQAQSSNRGLGQIAKEAVVFAGVSAGVNAAVNRLLPGGSRGGGTNTQITYNNYYNNQTDSNGNPVPAPAPAAPAAVAPAAAAPAAAAPPAMAPPAMAPAAAETSSAANTAPVNPAGPVAPSTTGAGSPNSDEPLKVIPLNGDAANSGSQSSGQLDQTSGNSMAPPAQTNLVSNEELIKLSEELFKADTNNAFKHITLKLQGQKTDDSVTDSASEPLLTVDPEALKISTIASLRALYDKYELDSKVAEKMTPEKREAESNLINTFVSTEVMSKALKFVADKGLIPNDEYEFKDALKRIWFSQYARENNIISSSGFENVFLAEKVYTVITGLHNWIYFNEQESAGKANYLGYIKDAKLGDNVAIVKLRATLNDVVRPVTTIFVGTSPELEMALYTVCFFVRPNGACPVSAGGTPFTIYTNKISYYGKEILFSAYPEI